jgi:nitrate reductase gamma subunit
MIFRNNSIIWLGSYGFHLALVAIAFWFVLFLFGVSLPWLVRIGGVVLLGASLYLLAVRTFVKQLRDLSTFVEFFNLAIFVLISTTGLIVLGEGLGEQVRTYFLGLLSLRPIPPPPNNLFLIHLLLLEFTLVYLPFSKMFHMASKYFTFHELRWKNPYEEKSH